MPTFIASTLMTRVRTNSNTYQNKCHYFTWEGIINYGTLIYFQDQGKYCKQSWEKALIGTLRPLIEDCPPSAEMCSFLSHHCKDQSSLPIIKDSLVYTITRILKHNFVSIYFKYLLLLYFNYCILSVMFELLFSTFT